MCGITGLFAYNQVGRFSAIKLSESIQVLGKRGPDFSDSAIIDPVYLGHARLSIIDLSIEAKQPMSDESGRYTIVFNGEIYNYKTIKQKLENQGISFNTNSDTEVLLKSFIHQKEKCLDELNGFFAFAIYDKEEEELFLARDRMGIKPLLYYEDEDKFIFASEMKALIKYGIEKEINYESLKFYLQLNYIPQPLSIFKNVHKVEAGQYLRVKKRKIEKFKYYQVPTPNTPVSSSFASYESQKKALEELLEASIQKRLISDVPLGTFLSGGIDSSVITALASRHTKQLNTFSVGYKDEAFFDETKYARAVADKYKTNHTVFSLSNKDLFDHLFDILDYIDEPFADSSAIAVYILSKETKQKVSVALSGDGADEMFSGYNKHSAEYRARAGGLKAKFVTSLSGLWAKLPKSRNGFFSNKFRQLHRFSEGVKMTPKERYWRWATFVQANEVEHLLSKDSLSKLNQETYKGLESNILSYINDSHKGIEHFNEILYTDLHLVLQGDMLTKVDLMSMANGLEVRVPFLDHDLVNFVATLPTSAKINKSIRKRILQETFKNILPPSLFKRPKHGFEVPLLKWFQNELKSWIDTEMLDDAFIEQQGIFNLTAIQSLKKQLFSSNSGDVHARIWGLLVFQSWWKKMML